MNYAEDTLADLRAFAQDDLPHYTTCLREAFTQVRPVFVRSRYGEFFWHCATTVKGWLASVVLANADAESEGSRKLMRLWRSVRGLPEVEAAILAHARDEAGHARIFVGLAETAFPGARTAFNTAATRRRMTKIPRGGLRKGRRPVDDGTLIDHLVQMNIGEIRTRFHMHLLGPAVFNGAPSASQARTERTLQRLGGDEVRHIGYTARLMEQWCRDGNRERIRQLYRRRLADFNAITLRQTEAAVRHYGQGRYPDLLEI